jgi:hypothetical protein
MNLKNIQSIVLEVLQEVQTLSGRRWIGLGPSAKPIGQLDGFDSQNGLEATAMIEKKLGCKIAPDSIFVSEDGKRVLTVREATERIARLNFQKGVIR